MTTPTLSNITDAEAALILAVRGLLTRSGSSAAAEQPTLLATTPAAQPLPTPRYNPAWKTASSNGRQFTQEGVNAVAKMFRDGLSNKEVAELMHIGIGSAATYRERYEGKRDWGRFKPQPQS